MAELQIRIGHLRSEAERLSISCFAGRRVARLLQRMAILYPDSEIPRLCRNRPFVVHNCSVPTAGIACLIAKSELAVPGSPKSKEPHPTLSSFLQKQRRVPARAKLPGRPEVGMPVIADRSQALHRPYRLIKTLEIGFGPGQVSRVNQGGAYRCHNPRSRRAAMRRFART